MTTFVHNDLDVTAANIVASGQPLYPAVERASAVAAVANHANEIETSTHYFKSCLCRPAPLDWQLLLQVGWLAYG